MVRTLSTPLQQPPIVIKSSNKTQERKPLTHPNRVYLLLALTGSRPRRRSLQGRPGNLNLRLREYHSRRSRGQHTDILWQISCAAAHRVEGICPVKLPAVHGGYPHRG
jgi:hypothetical protein